MQWTVKIIIHDEWGGFHLTSEMVKMLKARGCKWADRCGGPHGGAYYLPSSEGDNYENFRKDPIFVAVVEELTERYEGETTNTKEKWIPWRKRAELRRDLLANLKVVEVTVVLEIEDLDGREKVRVTGGVW